MLDEPEDLLQWKTSLVDKGRAVDIAYLNFRNTLAPSPHQILIEKLLKYGLDEQTIRQI